MFQALETYQIILAALTIVAALNVIAARNPVVSAMSLMATLFTTGALYFGLGSFFIGAVQILIYAGAVSVLFVFIVMLLDLKPSLVRIPGQAAKSVVALIGGSLLAAGLLVPFLKWATHGPQALAAPADAAAIEASANATSIALRFLSKYMLPFQLTGMLIFAAVIGVILVGRKHHTPKID